MTLQCSSARQARSAGFTLIELSAALALVAILVSFLPAVQKMRELTNKQAAERTLHVMGSRLVKHYQTGGKLPGSLNEALQITDLVASGGAFHGYRLSVLESAANLLRVSAEPVPGVTGSETAILQIVPGPAGVHYALNFTRIAGADVERRRMLDEVTAALARSFSRLAGLLPAVQTEVALKDVRAEAASSVRQQQTFDALRGTGGSVNMGSVMNHLTSAPAPPAVTEIFRQLAHELRGTLRLGVFGENTSTTAGVSSLPAVQVSDRLVELPRLVELTGSMVDIAELREALLAALQDVERAEARHDVVARNRALALYRELLAREATRSAREITEGRTTRTLFSTIHTLSRLAAAL